MGAIRSVKYLKERTIGKLKESTPKQVKYLINTIESYGYQAYVVGGAIRDCAIGYEPKDWDIATSMRPSMVMNILNDNGISVIPTGIDYGTVTAMVDDIGYEITTFRLDSEETDGRRPKVVTFSSSIEEDLSRRDFTINAMAYSPTSNTIVDPYNGIQDIFNKSLKFVGKPINRIREDNLRILRAYRFSSKYGLAMSYEDMGEHIRQFYLYLYLTGGCVEGVSKERVREEFNKIVMGDNIKYAFEKMILDGTVNAKFSDYIKYFGDMYSFDQNNPYHNLNLFDHTMKAIEYAPNDLGIKLALLFHDTGKLFTVTKDDNGISHYHEHSIASNDIVDNFLDELKYDTKTKIRVSTLVGYHDCVIQDTRKGVKKALNKFGREILLDILTIRRCDVIAQNPKYCSERLDKIDRIKTLIREIEMNNECFTIKDLEIDGNDVMAIVGIRGRNVGHILDVVLNEVIDNRIPNKRPLILEFLRLHGKDYLE